MINFGIFHDRNLDELERQMKQAMKNVPFAKVKSYEIQYLNGEYVATVLIEDSDD